MTRTGAYKTNREVFDDDCSNPKLCKAWNSLANQALGVCFKPYKDFLNLQTWWGKFESTKPSGCCIKTSFFKSPWWKALLMSNWLKNQSNWTTKDNKILIVANFATGLIFSS